MTEVLIQSRNIVRKFQRICESECILELIYDYFILISLSNCNKNKNPKLKFDQVSGYLHNSSLALLYIDTLSLLEGVEKKKDNHEEPSNFNSLWNLVKHNFSDDLEPKIFEKLQNLNKKYNNKDLKLFRNYNSHAIYNGENKHYESESYAINNWDNVSAELWQSFLVHLVNHNVIEKFDYHEYKSKTKLTFEKSLNEILINLKVTIE